MKRYNAELITCRLEGKSFPNPSAPNRETYIVIINATDEDFNITQEELKHSSWSSYSDNKSKIPARNKGLITSQSYGSFTSIEGNVKLLSNNTGCELLIHWNNPFIGGNRYKLKSRNNGNENFKDGTTHLNSYSIKYHEESGDNATVYLNITNKITPKNYNIIIASDPQAWRLIGGDPNSSDNMEPWLELNRRVVNSMNQLSIQEKIHFAIINGDLTEFGRNTTLATFYSTYNKLSFLYLLGLGNHDYANNVGDCLDYEYPLDTALSKDGCALNLVNHMIDSIYMYSSILPSEYKFNFDYDKNKKTGSLAYSWDYGDIHYVQLQNYPTYDVILNDDIHITSSIDWLENDLQNAVSRNKVTVLNFHDATDHFEKYFNNSSTQNKTREKDRFKNLINNNQVIAVFCGHTHQVKLQQIVDQTIFGNIPVYNSGALFKGDFLLIKVKGKNLDVSIYDGKTGIPQCINSLTTCPPPISQASYVKFNNNIPLSDLDLKNLNLTIAEKAFSRARNGDGFDSKDYASWKDWYDDCNWSAPLGRGIYDRGRRLAEKWDFLFISYNPYGLVFNDRSFCVGIISDDTKSGTDNWITAAGDDWGSGDKYAGQMYFDKNGRPVALVMTNNFSGAWGTGWSYIYRNGQWDYESDEDWHKTFFANSTDSLDPNAPIFEI